jgi:prolyl-tRNA editing enzyme YbaK/EbsC (Cys-tRNA(Pro) deacylase)
MDRMMTNRLSKKAKKVQKYIKDTGFEFKVAELPDSTRTVEQAARTLGCQISQITKSLVFKDDSKDEPVLVIASGSNRFSPAKIEITT